MPGTLEMTTEHEDAMLLLSTTSNLLDTVECCSYGATADGKLVSSAGLEALKGMGFDPALAAEALKQVFAVIGDLSHLMSSMWQML